MARRIAGEDPLELREAFAAMGEVEDLTGMETFIREWPVVRTPAFAALIRQDYLRLRAEHPEAGAPFRVAYSDLYWLLHEEAHRDQCRLAHEELGPPAAAAVGQTETMVPALHARLLDLFEGRPPPPSTGPPADPSHEADRIADELSKVLGDLGPLPDYVARPGIGWTFVAVACARCDNEYSSARPHFIDLVAAPDLAEALLAGALDSPGCPNCGDVCVRPLGVFMEDPPFAGDALASLSCVWRFDHDFFVYQPPPGTTRRDVWDRVLEIRFGLRVEDLDWAEDNREAADSSSSFGIAYTPDELRALLAARSDDAAIPRDMTFAIEGIVQKLRNGTLPVHQAEDQIAEGYGQFAGQWPVAAPPSPGGSGDYLEEGLVQALLAETLARAGDRPKLGQATLAALTAQYYFALNEPAAAERALSRAVDMLAAVPPAEQGRTAVEAFLKQVNAELLDILGRHEEADRLRQEYHAHIGHDLSTLEGRAGAAQRRERAALSEFEQGRLGAALGAYPECVKELRTLVAEAEAAEVPDAAVLTDSIRHNLCAAIANFGSVLQDAALVVDAATRYYGGGTPEEIWRDLQTDALSAVQNLRGLRPRLRQLFPQGFSVEQIRARAGSLLQEALDLAEALPAWAFAAVQADRLSALAELAGDDEEAVALAQRVIDYALRAGDHARAGTRMLYLAHRHLDLGEGGTALDLLESSGLEWMRERIGRGHHLGADPMVSVLGKGLLRAVDQGADVSRAVLTIESLKAATTASSLAIGFPMRPSTGVESTLAAEVDAAARNCEELRLELIWSPEDPDRLKALTTAHEELMELRRRLSLRDSRFAEWVDATDVRVSDTEAVMKRLRLLGPGTRLLGVFAAVDSITTYMLGPDGPRLSSCPSSEVPSTDSLAESDLEGLAACFLEPFADELARMAPSDRLLVSPDFGFFEVPFAALPVNGGPLCAQVTTSCVQGAGVLEAVLGRGREAFSSALAIGGPRRPEPDLPDLPGAESEAKRILQLLEDGRPALTGRKATFPALVAALDDVDVLHLACHAAESDPAGAGAQLFLTPDPRNSDSGVLTEDRIVAELDLPAGCLVNLAGCSTASQLRRSGPLLGGLVPAFLVAGAGSVLASISPLEDGDATVFQEHFYRLLRGGLSPSESLAACQRACIDGELGDEMTAMGAWAFYVLYGTS